ncbi:uncharacterized protein EV422DRAFT_578840 [Fimicolochytrium jonesii]|uniref:uncharacterized protein n=1 Tax=Fimicolochytrium jonesii TaxID=1396493 RepID=UPI0022FEDADF|nr:uncharacterized protein EV422DRAFT_578840 [Fimicolochytrium jonesii]KAI8820546.1 hypothetical protein EV422DRAFT_578840 [Fimicolochytrium jonesii]
MPAPPSPADQRIVSLFEHTTLDVDVDDEHSVFEFMSAAETSREVAIRFLSCVGYEVDAAVGRYQRYQALAKQNSLKPVPDPTALLVHYLNVPLFSLPGTSDKNGSTLIIFNARYWVADAAGTRRMLKLLQYICHKASASAQTRQNGITLISNLDKLDGRSQVVEVHRWLMQMLEYYMPVHLNRVLVWQAPYWNQMFPYAWQPGACPDGPLSAEMVTCKDLTTYVDASQLPKELGGDLSFKYKEWVADQLASALKASIYPPQRLEQCAHDVLVDVDLGGSNAVPSSNTDDLTASITSSTTMSSVVASEQPSVRSSAPSSPAATDSQSLKSSSTGTLKGLFAQSPLSSFLREKSSDYFGHKQPAPHMDVKTGDRYLNAKNNGKSGGALFPVTPPLTASTPTLSDTDEPVIDMIEPNDDLA